MPAIRSPHRQHAGSYNDRLRELGEFLHAHEALWRPQPFHHPRPDWCARHPQLTAGLLALDDAQVDALAADDAALASWLGAYLPELRALPGLAEVVAMAPADGTRIEAPAGLLTHVPGRKQAQIRAFARAVGAVDQPLLEWCAGKGHLGRYLAWQHAVRVTSLELDPALVEAGRALAQRAALPQDFVRADVLAPAAAENLRGRHAVALHACGGLHLALLGAAASHRPPALDVAPCCYDRIAAERYRPLAATLPIELRREELHLAVTDTVAAGARERRVRDTAMAWKLAFLELRAQCAGLPRERPFKPVPAAWLGLGFAGWMERLARREGMPLPHGLDWGALEAQGWRRRQEVLRLDLVRLAFRRALEVWLVLDRAVFLERAGYAVRVQQFCRRDITPRNLLISARG